MDRSMKDRSTEGTGILYQTGQPVFELIVVVRSGHRMEPAELNASIRSAAEYPAARLMSFVADAYPAQTISDVPQNYFKARLNFPPCEHS
jgi:hypothetical protein